MSGYPLKSESYQTFVAQTLFRKACVEGKMRLGSASPKPSLDLKGELVPGHSKSFYQKRSDLLRLLLRNELDLRTTLERIPYDIDRLVLFSL